MRISELAYELKVSRQHVDKTARNLKLNLEPLNGIIWLTPQQIKQIKYAIGGRE